MAIPDYEGEPTNFGAPNDVDKLKEMVLHLAELTIKKEELESNLEEVSHEIKKYEEGLIPEIMTKIGIDDMKLHSGLRLQLKEMVKATWPKEKERQDICTEWLRKTGNDGIIKNQFVIRLDRGKDAFAEKIEKTLKDMGIDEHAEMEKNTTVHHSTLVSFLKKQKDAGKEIPEAFGVFTRKFAKIHKKR